MAYTTINDPALYFQTKTYSGSNSDLSVTFDGENDMQPDLVWLKSRSTNNYNHFWNGFTEYVVDDFYTKIGNMS